MYIGYARVSKADGSQSLDLQRDALIQAGVLPDALFEDKISGKNTERPGLRLCLASLRQGDTLMVWKLDRLGRSLKELIQLIQDLEERGVAFVVLTGQGAHMDTRTAGGKLIFSIFAALAEFERELIRERTMAGLEAARARGRKGGRRFALNKTQVHFAQMAMQEQRMPVTDLCKELGISRVTLYRYVGPDGRLRAYGKQVLGLSFQD